MIGGTASHCLINISISGFDLIATINLLRSRLISVLMRGITDFADSSKKAKRP